MAVNNQQVEDLQSLLRERDGQLKEKDRDLQELSERLHASAASQSSEEAVAPPDHLARWHAKLDDLKR